MGDRPPEPVGIDSLRPVDDHQGIRRGNPTSKHLGNRNVAIFRATRNGVRPISGANNWATVLPSAARVRPASIIPAARNVNSTPSAGQGAFVSVRPSRCNAEMRT